MTPAMVAGIALGLIGIAALSNRRNASTPALTDGTIDPATGLPLYQQDTTVDPNTGLPYVDPTTGQPYTGPTYAPGIQAGPVYQPGSQVDPTTGQPYDPTTGQPYDPSQIDPTTGQPYGYGSSSSGGSSSGGSSSGGAGYSASTYSLQQQLRQLGYAVGNADGIMGPTTRAAIVQFQRDNGLTPDGIPGPQFMAALASKQSSLDVVNFGADFGGFGLQRFGRPNPAPRSRRANPPRRIYEKY